MKKQKLWKKKLFWLIAIIFVFILVLVISEIDREEEPPQPEQITETTEIPETEKTLIEPSFDVPSLLGKNAFEIKEILEARYGEPVSFWEPTEAMFGPAPGAMSWLDEETGIIFSFEYWQDGSINNNILFLGGAKEQGQTIESVLQAGNLRQDDQAYKIEINPLGIAEMVDIWVSPAKE